MKEAGEFLVVFVTAPDLETARTLTKAVLEARVAACVNVVTAIESHYWWQDKIESSNEVLMIIKTTETMVSELEKVILSRHPYDTPEFVVLPISGGSEKYLKWLGDNVRAGD